MVERGRRINPTQSHWCPLVQISALKLKIAALEAIVQEQDMLLLGADRGGAPPRELLCSACACAVDEDQRERVEAEHFVPGLHGLTASDIATAVKVCDVVTRYPSTRLHPMVSELALSCREYVSLGMLVSSALGGAVVLIPSALQGVSGEAKRGEEL